MFNLNAQPAQGGFDPKILILWGGVILVFYFLLYRPQKKRQQQAKQMQSQLAPGDKVTTIGGIVGKVVKVTDDSVVIKVNDLEGTQMTLTKWAVGSVESANTTTVE